MPPGVVPGPATQPPFFPWEKALPIPGSGVGYTSVPVGAGNPWFVRVGGNNDNGGSSTSLVADRSGTDAVLNNTATFVSATAAFTSADVGKGICIGSAAAARHTRIVAFTNATTVTLDRAIPITGPGNAWKLGGAWADWRAGLGAQAFNVDFASPMAAGDNLYIGGGTYSAPLTTFLSYGAPGLYVLGDTDGVKTGDAGMVLLTGGGGSTLLQLSGTSNWTFANLFMEDQGFANTGGITGNTSGAPSGRNVTFYNCALASLAGAANPLMNLTCPYGRPLDWTFDRCVIYGYFRNGNAFAFFPTGVNTGAQEDYEMNVQIRNSVLIGVQVTVSNVGGTTRSGNGVHLTNVTFMGSQGTPLTVGASCSTRFPSTMYGCAILGLPQANSYVNANVLGQIIEDWNYTQTGNPRTNVGVGPHSTSGEAYFHFGQERIWGGAQRPYGEPMQVSTLRRFGTINTGAGPLDQRGGPRPSLAAAWDVGGFQRANTATQNTTVVEAGANSIQIQGGGWQDFDVPVDATATTLSIWVRYDSNYRGPLPTVSVVKGSQAGVGGASVPVSTASLNNFQQYSLAINPTSKGIVTLRLVSNDVSANGLCYFDAFAVA